jgi:hemerythrin superfamily protein
VCFALRLFLAASDVERALRHAHWADATGSRLRPLSPHLTHKYSGAAMNTANPDTIATDAITLLKEDHKAVNKLFDAFERAADDDLEAKGTLAQRACEKLTVHTIIEEELLYPAAQAALSDEHEVDVDEAYVEHYLVKTLISRFDSLRPGERGFDATFKVMTEMVRHHVEEEETDLFPLLRKSKADLESLGRKMAARKAQLEQKLEQAGSKLVGDKT